MLSTTETSCTSVLMYKYYLFNKPYNVLSQFTKEVPDHITLADFIDVEKDVYPVGRLDRDSEGLLLLTNDNKLKTRLLDPKTKAKKTYHAQLDGAISKEAIIQLRNGVDIKVNKKVYHTLPADVHFLDNIQYPDRNPPVRYRANIPTSWIEIRIHEGKNRQIRRMCAAVGYPVLRLIRTQIGGLKDGDIEAGSVRELQSHEVKKLFHT